MPAGGTPFDPVTYQRLIELYEDDGTTLIEVLSDRERSDGADSVESCSFQLLRQGGCGEGRLTLCKDFDYTTIEVGQFVKVSYSAGDAWYLGRVEQIEHENVSGVEVQMMGGMSLLHDHPLGGMHRYDVRPPHLFANSDYYVNDPDRSQQSWDTIDSYTELVQAIYDSYIFPLTGIGLGDIEIPDVPIEFRSMVFRGEESLAEVIRSLATAQYGASWGVDADFNFFFTQRKTDEIASFSQGLDLQDLTRSQDRTLMYNRIVLTGGYVYREGDDYPELAFRYCAPWIDAASIAEFGEKYIDLYIPWVRNDQEAKKFIDGFFRDYAGPRTRYTATTLGQAVCLKPWDGNIKLSDRHIVELVVEQFDSVQVEFNEAPVFTFTTGPEELQYPTPPEPQRWEQAGEQGRGDDNNVSGISVSNFSVTLTSTNDISTPESDYTGTDRASDYPSDTQSNFPSDNQSNFPSEDASNFPSGNQSNFPSDIASNFPSDIASNFPSEDASNFPSEDASNFPSEDASNFPSDSASNFPSSDASNYPSSHWDGFPSSAEGGSQPDPDCVDVLSDVSIEASCVDGTVNIEITKTFVSVQRCGA